MLSSCPNSWLGSRNQASSPGRPGSIGHCVCATLPVLQGPRKMSTVHGLEQVGGQCSFPKGQLSSSPFYSFHLLPFFLFPGLLRQLSSSPCGLLLVTGLGWAIFLPCSWWDNKVSCLGGWLATLVGHLAGGLFIHLSKHPLKSTELGRG